jgi:hypothetical protein
MRHCWFYREPELQRLKPPSICGVYVVAKATTYKDSRLATPTYCAGADGVTISTVACCDSK